ncbi:MAG TPA: hypothetical protein DCY13_06070, partial [Verrucomicrobiales bacterium]|nr:hypothetical protein [Verrucomicrobiales bacterium]
MLTLGLLFSGGDVHADNTAPTLGNGILASISEDSASPTGQTVSTVFSGQFTDPDAGASLSGIAVVGNTANAGTHGAWQYSTNSGSNWFPIGTVADDATALAISASALIRFVPVANYHGTPPALTVRGLDNTYAGGFSSTGASETRVTVDTSSNGGSTPVAGATSSLSTSVTPVADTPSVTNATTNEDTQTTSGLVISRNAADGTEVTHFRITAITNGTLYQNNGTTTIANNAFITFAQGNAGLKFTPSANFSGTASFTVQASTSNAVGGLGGTTVTATITVNAVNDAPTITDIAHQSTHTNTPTAALAFTVGDVETAAASLVLSGTSANPTLVPNGNIVFGGSGASRTVTVTPAADQTGTTTISVSVSDGTTNTVDTFTLGVTVPAQRVLSGTATIGASATSTNITIAQVHLGRSFLVFSSTVSDGDPGETQVRGQITSPTTIAFNRATSGTAVSISWSVVEYASGVTVQRGTTNSWSTTSTGVTLAGIATNRSVPIITASVPGNIHSEDDFIRARFTSATNLELTRIGSNSAATVDWQVIEFANATVQAGDLSFLAGDASKTATITSVNTNKSWLLYTFRSPDGTIANIGQKLLRGLITSSTNLTFDRSNTGQALDLAWHLVEFTDATTVRHGTEPFGAAELQRDVTIASVNTDKSFAIGGKYGRGGRSTYSGDDNPGVGWMTLELTSSTNLRITRSLTGSTAADMGWYVVQMPNVLPTISSIADLSTDEDTATTALGFTVNDLETAAASLTVSGSSSDQTLVPDANIVFGGSGANRTVTVTPAANQHGSATITVTVGDGTDTATETFVLTVNPVNDAPVLSGANDFTSVMAGDADHAG